ncbi:ABC transporter permease [Hyphomonas johnsonii MHS-2]|uniref:ABC transporter permease n=2 Tax=Hyphomonas johnsonii TaxID=81031 RepID=A0A059FAE7_9PROT|nr:ABC transporter permease [Hyphomonas johnsonii MHS-2]
MAFAIDQIQQRYRRSRIGFAWIIVSYLIFVGSISLFFGNFSDLAHRHFTAYVAINYAIFQFLMANISDGCAVFRSAKTWISSTPLPHSIHVFKSIARSLFVFVVCLIVAFIVLLVLGQKFSPVALLSIPAFIVLLINAVFIQITFGYAAARYRDVDYFMQSITRILFFTTPILWVRDEHMKTGLRLALSEFNPFTHALEIFSSPLLGELPDPKSWIIIGWLTIANCVIAICVAGVSHRRLAFWL